ncbi:MATE family efflux transporter [Oceanispirochaeta crateris]|uniref:MATE family efflux transporter n=2 Tax=Oceanispirochaeta crateris TaxID=2518645 RepID=A0A5C1QQZ1_9SPIO|nr:MATE family efflux transporter [Oceanispirochaeta crateris]
MSGVYKKRLSVCGLFNRARVLWLNMNEQILTEPYTSGILSRLKQDGESFRKLLILALPIAAQTLIQTLLNLVDTLMIGQLGETSIAAVALCNQIFFLLLLFLFGVSSGSSVFTAQFWGKKDLPGIHRSLGMALVLGLSGAAIFTLAAQIFPAQILRIYTKDQRVIEAGIPYLRIASASYLFTAGTIIFQGVLRSTGVVKLPLFLSVTALSLNAFFNYALIFGRFGLPRLGIAGAAMATSGARILEVISLLLIIYIQKYPIAGSIRQLACQNRLFFKRFIHRVSPVILNEVGWSFGMTMFTLVYARMGTDVLAAYNIMDTFSRLTIVLFVGTGNATAIVLGNIIGEGREDEARRSAKTILMVAPLLAAFVGIIIFVLAPFVPGFFNISPYVSTLIVQMLRIFTVVIFVKVSNMHIIVGILRSGGDTHFCAALELIPLWLVSIPLAAFAGLVLNLPPPLVYLLCLSEEVIKYMIGLYRVLSGKWVHDLT